MTKPTKTTSPTRSRDKVLQTLYELELGGEELNEVLKNHSSEKSNKFYKEILKGVSENLEGFDKTIQDYVDRPIQQLDVCLLYTSPSPRDRQKSRMPSSA